MLRAAVWTGGLFVVGGGICQIFPGPWIEPLVLIGLGAALVFVAGRAPARSTTDAMPSDATAGDDGDADAERTVAR